MADNDDADIHRPTAAAEVAELLRRAAADEVPVTVVSGGHGPWSHAPASGVRIELSGLAGIAVEGTTVHIGGGAVWGDVAEALASHGLALSSGDTASVGVGGLTLGGGIGWMVRSRGLAADQLIGAQVVTASGDIVETSAEEHPGLFWGLRGGGGNLGVVTRFDFAAQPLDGIAYADCVVEGDQVAVLRAMRDLLRDAPRELTVTYMDVPPMDPSAPAGARLSAVWAAPDAEALRDVLAPISALDGVTTTVSTPAYRDILLEMPHADGEEPPGFIGGNGLYAELDDDLVDRLVAFRRAYPASVVFLRSLGGAYADIPQEATPFPARTATWFVMAGGFDVPGLVDDVTRATISADWADMAQGRLAEYGNFADTERPDAVPGMFAPEALERLRELKTEWDPHNLLRRNHNIAPEQRAS
ncbi:FAD-binding oxidoreductase [Streptomyces sp. AC495_CC817]|uniref:FAD-binding oxidoreductase n=1 Tax=Streptomyces sp. AC495_CC817 TaxID=2823900 RepID=UPI001C27F662|nr:FAD-binding protein [Streptomyces sp. AC495_CC817]